MGRKFFTTCWVLLYSGFVYPQMVVDTARTPVDIVREVLLGEGISARNIRFRGSEVSLGTFDDKTAELGMTEGIILSTGNVYFAPGPNRSQYTSWVNQHLGDTDLESIARGRTYDAAILEFDFIANSNRLSFEYAFASEEYLEYVGSKFNDVFAFWIHRLGSEEKINVAVLPDGITPVTVNSINHQRNKEFYVDNDYTNTSDPVLWDTRKRKVIKNDNYGKVPVPTRYSYQFDGATKVLTATLELIPREEYHIKIAIADVADAIYDSGVLLKAGSFRSTGDITVPILSHLITELSPTEGIGIRPVAPAGKSRIYLRTTVLPGPVKHFVHFDFDRSIIPDRQKDLLNWAARLLAKDPSLGLTILGHTDSDGSGEYNQDLSRRRSESVFRYFLSKNIPAEKLLISYFGEDEPLESNETAEGRAANRRVEIVFRLSEK